MVNLLKLSHWTVKYRSVSSIDDDMYQESMDLNAESY